MKYDFDKIIDRSVVVTSSMRLCCHVGEERIFFLSGWLIWILRHLHLSQMPSKTDRNILSSAIR